MQDWMLLFSKLTIFFLAPVGNGRAHRNEESQSVSDSSDSYDMIEYGLK